MKRRVRKNQWIDGVIYNGHNILLIEKNRLEKKILSQSTVIICDGHYLGVGEMHDRDYVGRCVFWHDPMMHWTNYEQYLSSSMVRTLICYLKIQAGGLEVASQELMQYILDNDITGNVLLVGHSKAGLMMYRVGTELPHDERRNVTVLTVSAPFAGTYMASRQSFKECRKKYFPKLLTWIHKRICSEHRGDLDIEVGSKFLKELEPLPYDVRHVAFISSAYDLKRPCNSLRDYFLKLLDNWCFIDGDGVVSFESQEMWPLWHDKKLRRIPDMCLVVSATHANSLERVLSDFGKYACDEFFFSKLEDFCNCEEVEKLTGGSDFF